jgi:hypothetical protein
VFPDSGEIAAAVAATREFDQMLHVLATSFLEAIARTSVSRDNGRRPLDQILQRGGFQNPPTPSSKSLKKSAKFFFEALDRAIGSIG